MDFIITDEKKTRNYREFVDNHRLFGCTVDSCKTRCDSNAALISHQRGVHRMRGGGIYLCPIKGCGRGVEENGFSRKTHFRSHTRNIHDPEQPKRSRKRPERMHEPLSYERLIEFHKDVSSMAQDNFLLNSPTAQASLGESPEADMHLKDWLLNYTIGNTSDNTPSFSAPASLSTSESISEQAFTIPQEAQMRLRAAAEDETGNALQNKIYIKIYECLVCRRNFLSQDARQNCPHYTAKQKSREEQRRALRAARRNIVRHSQLEPLEHKMMKVIVMNSHIHRDGLFAGEDIKKSHIIIEYTGEYITNEEAQAREKSDIDQGRVISYRFKIDKNTVLDASGIKCDGNQSRYINHSCKPNSEVKVVQIGGRKRLLFYARRKINKCEEITYDYKFDLETDSSLRIRCQCRAEGCKGFLN